MKVSRTLLVVPKPPTHLPSDSNREPLGSKLVGSKIVHALQMFKEDWYDVIFVHTSHVQTSAFSSRYCSVGWQGPKSVRYGSFSPVVPRLLESGQVRKASAYVGMLAASIVAVEWLIGENHLKSRARCLLTALVVFLIDISILTFSSQKGPSPLDLARTYCQNYVNVNDVIGEGVFAT
ncbi:hypothetical protein DPMN_032200 [Dreissena polymorpha]|uniref:Uncharacterized protein n=1 Tax=Dreissena polymorpha TaxID=45954 RepID=A0A9D4M3I3_DREPO|nr:hypothetical protein DPMN_032200 [Dreissena polymorpha]